ncbi:FxsA family protein [Pyxidicoccus xibeiensis]|uniref:FxsA family protein n=1 Tax=Pyxidicoccus xibeiensis TaxID=2906759 RepID=UPI0020A82B8E|nr:FxsA family protein [Pyxidicoccus xibeiensis]MCP3140150.1 FxsA family protein [Pyxidicoccus xibeiensis]
MFKYLLLAFTVVPFIELYLLLAIGRQVGLVPTLAMVLVTGLVGASLARREGGRVVKSWRESMARGQVPEEGILSGALVLVGGALLVAPGVFTDVVGLLLLIPPTRRFVAARLKRMLERKVRDGSVRVTTVGFGGFGGFQDTRGGPFAGGVFQDGAGPAPRPRQEGPVQGEVDAEFTEDKPRH